MLLDYAAGARIIRPTRSPISETDRRSCIHLRQTHAVVRFLRELPPWRAGALLLTETNVPHEENISSSAAATSAHGLPVQPTPLVLDAF